MSDKINLNDKQYQDLLEKYKHKLKTTLNEKKEEVMGVISYRGGTVDFNKGGTGHIRINITKIPVEGLDCSLEMDVKVDF